MAHPPHVEAAVSFSARGMWEVPFWNLAAEAGHRHLHRRGCRTSVTQPPEIEGSDLLFSDASTRGRRLWTYVFDEAVALVSILAERCDVMVIGSSMAIARDLCHGIESVFIDHGEREDDVAVGYWTWTGTSPRRSSRRLRMPAWEDVAGNYPDEVASSVEALAAATGPDDARLVLWHGPPGTGKTTALRALTRAWQSWADLQYITDPEQFFGASAAYMADVLMERGSDDRTALLVLEDAGELMAPQARADTGQGLSRLLNLTDGMLGQGLNTVVLITTNEPLSVLHPAAARPGRCWAEIEFGAHTREEANRWLSDRGHDVRVSRDATLAELFALARGMAPPAKRRVGFG